LPLLPGLSVLPAEAGFQGNRRPAPIQEVRTVVIRRKRPYPEEELTKRNMHYLDRIESMAWRGVDADSMDKAIASARDAGVPWEAIEATLKDAGWSKP